MNIYNVNLIKKTILHILKIGSLGLQFKLDEMIYDVI